MFIVHFYTALLFIFTGFLNNSYAMVIYTNKNQSHHRSERQFRPVLNGIIFLLAANLVAKGTLALGGYQTPNLPNNVQGALYLTLNGQNANQQNPNWYPISNQIPYVGPSTPSPITQQQIVNIRDPYYEDLIDEQPKPNPIQKVIINRYNNLDDIFPAASEVIKVKSDGKKARVNDDTSESSSSSSGSSSSSEESTESYEDDAEIFPQGKQGEIEGEDGEEEDNARQQMTSSTTTTARPTQRPTIQTAEPTAPTSTTTKTATTNAVTSNQGYTFGYGPSNGNENVSITTPAPMNNTMAGRGNESVSDKLEPPRNNATSNTIGGVYGPPDLYGPPSNIYGPPSNVYGPPTDLYGPPSNTFGPPSNTYGAPHLGPHNYPSGGYGPSNGNENISITYGPPAYQKPFFSSPEDPFLNNYHNNYYDNPTYYTDLYKYNDVFNRFYKKYQYNYPSFNNYLGK